MSTLAGWQELHINKLIAIQIMQVVLPDSDVGDLERGRNCKKIHPLPSFFFCFMSYSQATHFMGWRKKLYIYWRNLIVQPVNMSLVTGPM